MRDEEDDTHKIKVVPLPSLDRLSVPTEYLFSHFHTLYIPRPTGQYLYSRPTTFITRLESGNWLSGVISVKPN